MLIPPMPNSLLSQIHPMEERHYRSVFLYVIPISEPLPFYQVPRRVSSGVNNGRKSSLLSSENWIVLSVLIQVLLNDFGASVVIRGLSSSNHQ